MNPSFDRTLKYSCAHDIMFFQTPKVNPTVYEINSTSGRKVTQIDFHAYHDMRCNRRRKLYNFPNYIYEANISRVKLIIQFAIYNNVYFVLHIDIVIHFRKFMLKFSYYTLHGIVFSKFSSLLSCFFFRTFIPLFCVIKMRMPYEPLITPICLSKLHRHLSE